MRIKILSFLILYAAILTACAAKGTLDIGTALYQDGRYAEAIDQFTQTIENTQHENELYLSYFLRAEAYQAMGSPKQAYHDYYAAKRISCHLVQQGQKGGRSRGTIPWNYCNQVADMKMAAVAANMPESEQKTIKQTVETLLHEYR